MESGGYFGENAARWATKHQSDFEEEYDLIRQFSGWCYAIIPNPVPAERETRTLVLCTLYFRSLEFFQATIALKKMGMRAPAAASLRSLLEIVFVFGACLNDESNIQAFMDQHELRRGKLIRKAREFKSESLAEIKTRATDVPDDDLRKPSKDFMQVSIEEWARRANLHDIYLTVYATLSSSVHPMMNNLLKYRVGDSTDPPVLDYLPTPADTELLLGTGVEFTCKMAGGLAEELNLNISPELERWRSFGRDLSSRTDPRAV